MPWIDVYVNLPDGVAAVAATRCRIVAGLRARGVRDHRRLDEAALVATELVQNALQHAGGCLAVVVSCTEGAVTVAVLDNALAVPRRRTPDDNGGRGLHIVAALGTACGVTRRGYGKHVWVRLRACP